MATKGSIAAEVKKDEYKKSIEGMLDKVISLMNEYNEDTAKQMFQDDIMRIVSNLQKAVENENIKRVDVGKAIDQISEKIGEKVSKKIKESKDESNKSKSKPKYSNSIVRLIRDIIERILNYRSSKADTKYNKDLYTSFAKEEITKGYFAPNNKDEHTEKQMLSDFITSLKILLQHKRLAKREELKAIDDELPSIKVQKLTKELDDVKKKLDELMAENARLSEKSITVKDNGSNSDDYGFPDKKSEPKAGNISHSVEHVQLIVQTDAQSINNSKDDDHVNKQANSVSTVFTELAVKQTSDHDEPVEQKAGEHVWLTKFLNLIKPNNQKGGHQI